MINTNFKCSHDDLVKYWNQEGNQDYELTVVDEGECGLCFGKPVKVLTQHGAERFGVRAGFCINCTAFIIPIHPDLLEYPVGFPESEETHIIRVDCEKLENFLKRSDKNNFLSESEIDSLINAVEKNKTNPDLALAREYKRKAYQCTSCFGYILKVLSDGRVDNFRDLKLMRSIDNYLVACFGCSSLISRASGCSMLTCPNTLCKIQICAFCLNGASKEGDLKHDIFTCSQSIYNRMPPPEPRLCECSAEKKD